MVSGITGEKSKRTTKKGITLIALVVTIIVLLILAGVTIQMVVGQNGILSRAREAKEKNEIAEYKEEMELLLLDMQTESILMGESDEDFLQRYKEKLEEMYGEDVTVEELEDGSKLNVTTKEGYEFEVTPEKVEYKGKTGESKTESEQETEVKITYDNINWSKTKEVTIEAEGKEIEYIEGEEAYSKGVWQEYNQPLTITENGTKIYARVKGEKKETIEIIAKIDRVVPMEVKLEKLTEEETTVEVRATGIDGGNIEEKSGVSKFVFEIATDEGEYITSEDGTTIVIPDGEGKGETRYTYEGLEKGHIYKLRVRAYDQAENEIILLDDEIIEVNKSKEVTAVDVASNLNKYIGSYVNYGLNLDKDENSADWRIFYAQNVDGQDRVYLIAEDYIPTNLSQLTTVRSKTGMEKATQSTEFAKLNMNWPNGKSSLVDVSKWKTIFKDGNYKWNSSNEGSKCASTLLQPSYWSTFKATGGDYVIGGPTIQMWCAAWNTIMPEVGTNPDGFMRITANTTNDYGYCLSSSLATKQTSMYVDGTNTELEADKKTLLETNDIYNLFFTHTDSYNNITMEDGTTGFCYGYWLASPAANAQGSVVRVGWKGRVYTLNYKTEYGSGLRPIICMSSNIKLIESGEKEKGKPIYDIELISE